MFQAITKEQIADEHGDEHHVGQYRDVDVLCQYIATAEIQAGQ